MVCQPNLTWQMRAILVDWLVDVHFMMKLQGPTLWLTISLLDRALSRITVARTKLQLVGVAALSLACKMEEITLPYPDGELRYLPYFKYFLILYCMSLMVLTLHVYIC